MAYLLDTHLLLWAASDSPRLTAEARQILSDRSEIYFSTANLWEVVIKSAKGGQDFSYDAALVRSTALRAGYLELPIRSSHVLAVANLPLLRDDPFDRLLLAQAQVEQMRLLTVDQAVLSYGAPAMPAP